VLYTDEALYVGVRAFDTEPGAIEAALSRRDQQAAADELRVIIDSYHDRRTAYEFAVTPRGSVRDVYWHSDGGGSDASWDAVWQVRTTVDPEGWTAEFRIPLTQLRCDRSNTTWGLQVARRIQRRAEQSFWAPYFEATRAAALHGRWAELPGAGAPAGRGVEHGRGGQEFVR